MENKTKAETFIGFAVRSGKFRTGMNSVQTLKKAFLMIVCKSASENSLKEAKKTAAKFGCPLLKTESKLLEDAVHKENVKVMAITDRALAKAVLVHYGTDFTVVE